MSQLLNINWKKNKKILTRTVGYLMIAVVVLTITIVTGMKVVWFKGYIPGVSYGILMIIDLLATNDVALNGVTLAVLFIPVIMIFFIVEYTVEAKRYTKIGLWKCVPTRNIIKQSPLLKKMLKPDQTDMSYEDASNKVMILTVKTCSKTFLTITCYIVITSIYIG